MGTADGVVRGEPAAEVLGRGVGVEGAPAWGLGRDPPDAVTQRVGAD